MRIISETSVTIPFFISIFLGMSESGAGAEECVDEANDCVHISACKRLGLSAYEGEKSTTLSGRTCQAWSSQSPHKHGYYTTVGDHNFCRNGNEFNEIAPWCYTADIDMRWDYCFLACETDFGNKCVDLGNQCSYESVCRSAGLESYNGTKDTTVTGVTCQVWTTRKPHEHVFGVLGDHNHCRNADNAAAPWCMTTDPETSWDFCFEDCSKRDKPESTSCECQPLVIFDRDISNGLISSPNYPNPYCPGKECSWEIKAADPWMALRITFVDFDTDDLDKVGFWQIENKTLVFMDWFSGQGRRQDITTALGNGLKIVFKTRSSSLGFHFKFERFTAVSWSGVHEEELISKCEQSEYLSIFKHGSCYLIGPLNTYVQHDDERGIIFEEAFHVCKSFPNGHLAFLNSAQLAADIIDPVYEYLYEGWAKWIGLNQTTKHIVDRHEVAHAGWAWVLPDGRQWPARYEETRWDKTDKKGGEPDNWSGQDCAVVDSGTYEHYLSDVSCRFMIQYYCEYESLYPCHKVLYEVEESGTISSPSVSTKNIQCYYLLKTDSFHSVKLKLSQIDLGPGDSIRVFDGGNGTSHDNLLVVWVGKSVYSNGKPSEVVGKSSALTVVFTGAEHGSTFTAEFTKVESSCKCRNKTITILDKKGDNQEGTISSPGYPLDYCANMDCTWDFETATSDQIIQFTIITLDTYNNGDWLIIRDKENSASFEKTVSASFKELIGAAKLKKTEIKEIYLSRSYRPITFTAQHRAQIFFHSDSSVNGHGFKIKYKVVRRDVSCQCPQPQPKYFHEHESWLEFWHSEENCETIDCLYVLAVPNVPRDQKKHLKLTVKGRADTRQPNGFLRFREGTPYDYMGRRGLTQRIETGEIDLVYKQTFNSLQPFIKARSITVHYHAEAEGIPVIGNTGFRIHYNWTTGCGCGETKLSASPESEILTSPNYPFNNCPAVSCMWKISAPPDQLMVVEVLALKSEKDSEALQVFDGSASWYQLKLIKTLSGSISHPETIVSTSNVINVKYQLSSKRKMGGFRLKYYSKVVEQESFLPSLPTVSGKESALMIFVVAAATLSVVLFIVTMCLSICDRRKRNKMRRMRQVRRRQRRLERAAQEEKAQIQKCPKA